MAEYDLLLGVAYVVPVALVIAGDVMWTALLPLASLPLALMLFRVVHAGGDPRRLNPVLRETARLSLIYSLLLALGLAVPGIS
jgi:1,4-dihydroxy-2-naphthoate octaprenyltransferase